MAMDERSSRMGNARLASAMPAKAVVAAESGPFPG